MDLRLWAVTLCALAGASQTTGIEVGVSQQTFTNLRNAVLPKLIQDLTAVTLPDYVNTLGSGFFRVTVHVTKVHCTNFNLDVQNTGVTLKAPNQAVLAAAGLTGQMTFSWAYDTPLSSDSGDGAVQIKNTGMSATIAMSEVNGVPQMSVVNMNFTISDISITISNSPIANVANWLLSVLKNNFITDLTAALNQYGPSTLADAVNEVLGEYSTRVPLTDTIAIDYNFTTEPVVVSNSLVQLNVLGQFIDLTHPDQVMLVDAPPQLPPFDPSSSDIQVLVTDYTLNTGLYAGMTSGSFDVEINQQTPSIGAMLNTNTLDAAFPGLVDTFGKNLPCAFSCAATAPAPYFTLTEGNPGNMTGSVVLACDLLVTQTDQLQNRTVSLDISSTFGVEASLYQWVLNLTLTKSEVSNVDVTFYNLPKKPSGTALTAFLNLLMGAIVPSAFFSVFGQGVALPTYQGVDLSDATLTIMDRYISIQASPVFTFGLHPLDAR